MTRAECADRAGELCKRLTEEVNDLAPDGLGLSKRTWEIVDPASAEFMARLSAWEVDPTSATLSAVRIAYDELLEAWHLAATEYRRGVTK